MCLHLSFYFSIDSFSLGGGENQQISIGVVKSHYVFAA